MNINNSITSEVCYIKTEVSDAVTNPEMEQTKSELFKFLCFLCHLIWKVLILLLSNIMFY